MKKTIMTAILVLTLLLLGCSQPAAPSALAQEAKTNAAGEVTQGHTTTVEIRGFAFSPQTVTIKKGDTITWTQDDPTKHTITADDGSFDSPALAKGDSWSHTFEQQGKFDYHCSPHPNMKGKIIVE